MVTKAVTNIRSGTGKEAGLTRLELLTQAPTQSILTHITEGGESQRLETLS